MALLPLINNTLTARKMPGAVYSAQTCTRSNTTLTCAMLVQNTSHPAESKVQLHEFPVLQPDNSATSPEKIHSRRAQCTSCARANLTKVLTRLLHTVPVSSSVSQQLSFRVPHRISTDCLVAAYLHRTLCGANKTCGRLGRAIGCSTCLHHGDFMPAVLANLAVPQAVMPSTDSLWSRNWVFCPHIDQAGTGPWQDPALNTGVCQGSIPKSVWLDPRRRVDACARELIAEAPASASINFCLMNAQTELLCTKMASWLQRTEFYLCQASGLCEESDFFYLPTTFNLQEQEFVYDTTMLLHRGCGPGMSEDSHCCITGTIERGCPAAVLVCQYISVFPPTRTALVVSHSTCPPLSPFPHANSFMIGTTVT
jgi:hypothetical protein